MILTLAYELVGEEFLSFKCVRPWTAKSVKLAVLTLAEGATEGKISTSSKKFVLSGETNTVRLSERAVLESS